MTTIEKIKAEIERLKSQRVSGARAAQIGMETYCKKEAYDEVLSFLSTLESEKPMNQDELEKAVVDYFESYWPGMETAEQCNTDLHFTPPAIMRLARHFAQWGAERFAKIVRENLPEIGNNAQSQFERLYFEITGTKMYGGYND